MILFIYFLKTGPLWLPFSHQTGGDKSGSRKPVRKDDLSKE